MSTTHTIYIDEAGNTGDDLVHSNQPLFTLGALGIENGALASIETEINKLKASFKMSTNQEIKIKKMVGTKYEPMIFDIFNILLEHNCTPFFTFVEKKFMVAGRIIEDLLDPAFNKHTDDSWTWPRQEKMDIANYFYQYLSDQTIETAGVAFQKGAFADIERAFNQIQADIRGQACPHNLEYLIQGVSGELKELSDVKIGAEASFRSQFGASAGVLNSPNLTTYFELMSRLEGYLGSAGISADLIFDSSRQFDTAFAQMFQTMANAKPRELYLPGRRPLMFGFSHLSTFSAESSIKSLGLQLADLLVSSINLFFRKIAEDTPATTYSQRELFLIPFIYHLFDLQFADWIASDKLKKKYGEVFVREAKKLPTPTSGEAS